MRLLFIADGRSPTALSWLQYWIDNGHETHLISTFPCEPPPGIETFHILPIAFSGFRKTPPDPRSMKNYNDRTAYQLRNLLRPVRRIAGPFTLPFYINRYRSLLKEINPDLVHALRIPFEGMLASSTPAATPLVVSIWGNDITLHAHSSKPMERLTRKTLRRADGLIADAKRDIRLGKEWGFPPEKPTLIVPGAGGIRLEEMENPGNPATLPENLLNLPIVVNPRGQRPGSLRQDVFFRAIPMVLEKVPNTLFICPNLDGDSDAHHWVDKLGIGSSIKLWPHLDRAQMWHLYQIAAVFVSPSIHDGTPNSLLEAMASGCFPVVGNIESMQEWVNQGENGLLVDAKDEGNLANAIITALTNPGLRAKAKKENALIIADRATNQHCMAMTEAFYYNVINGLPLKTQDR